jgi:hypothetical protein
VCAPRSRSPCGSGSVTVLPRRMSRKTAAGIVRSTPGPGHRDRRHQGSPGRHRRLTFPLQAALGYDIGQSLFVGPDNVLVEGTRDHTYQTLISDASRSGTGRTWTNAWRILPA